ncbi:MAG: PspC domain-containing protein, partial [Clostridia bacterium]|nr:PspC domain-containing protein [Clostridia bacterium]
IQLPAFGLKFILSLIFLSVLHVWINGYKLIEAVKEINNVTYGFCPECGNSYSMAPPEAIKEEVKEPKFYRVREGKAIMGFCTGVSKYTGIPLLCPPRKNRQKTQVKNRMERMTNMVLSCCIVPHLFHGSLDNEPLKV